MRWVRISAALALMACGAAVFAADPRVLVVRIADVIGPASADFIVRGIERAEKEGHQLVVIELDTPGGLDTSMRQIIKKILASSVPVATYVHPEGARAASAGTFILYASHIAAMSPATNLGAASPVSIGGGAPAPRRTPGSSDSAPPTDVSASKAMNDAVAYIRGLAELRGRNLEFAEAAVREAASLPAQEALEQKVVDLVATDLRDLLRQLDGREITIGAGTVTLATAGAMFDLVEQDWRHKLLSLIANPQIAVVLMLIGVYGLFYEFTSPGFGVPGVAGATFLLLGLYAFHLLPINWAGFALIALGLSLVVAEAFVPSFGALGIGGAIAMVLGGLFLIDTDVPGMTISLPFLISMAVISAATFILTGRFAVQARSRRIVSGAEELVGMEGIVTVVDADGAFAHIHGESWRIRSQSSLSPGEKVRVSRMDGLILDVEKLN